MDVFILIQIFKTRYQAKHGRRAKKKIETKWTFVNCMIGAANTSPNVCIFSSFHFILKKVNFSMIITFHFNLSFYLFLQARDSTAQRCYRYFESVFYLLSHDTLFTSSRIVWTLNKAEMCICQRCWKMCFVSLTIQKYFFLIKNSNNRATAQSTSLITKIAVIVTFF